MQTPMVAILATSAVAWLAVGCREAEQTVSGQSWDCECLVDATDDFVEAHVCAMSAGEAAAMGVPCVEGAGIPVRFCDCVPSSTAFCNLGECVIR